jgi:Fe-S oxidoreductase
MAQREGSLEAAKREPIRWKESEFYDQAALEKEMERVFDVCHTCRRCVSLCQSFPVLFDLVDESETMEVDGVDKADYVKVVDECYLCDLCAETKCPYLPPHEFNIDFPHLMLRAKAVKYKNGDQKWRDKMITSTNALFNVAGTPGVAQIANAVNSSPMMRKAVAGIGGIHPEAPLPTFHSKTFKKRAASTEDTALEPVATDQTTGKVALFTTCYGNWNEPELGEDLAKVLTHNGIPMKTLQGEKCCGMPKLELGDLDAVEQLKDTNIPVLAAAIDAGYDILAPIPSCVLMFKQELPLMFPDDAEVQRVAEHIFDLFEYLALRMKAGELKTDFSHPLGKVAYHVACHQRVQNIGQKTKEVLSAIPGTEVTAIERCSGHDGTYALRNETYEHAIKIARPVVNQVKKLEPDHYGSDCPMAGHMIEHGLKNGRAPEHPIKLLRMAYGL